MNTTTSTHPKVNSNEYSLLIARLILRDTYLIIRSIQTPVVILLRYAAAVAAIANGLSRLAAVHDTDEGLI